MSWVYNFVLGGIYPSLLVAFELGITTSYSFKKNKHNFKNLKDYWTFFLYGSQSTSPKGAHILICRSHDMLPYVADLINLRWRTIINVFTMNRGEVQETEVKIDSGKDRKDELSCWPCFWRWSPGKMWPLEAGKQEGLSHPHSLQQQQPGCNPELPSRLIPFSSIPNNDRTNPCCLNHGFWQFIQK